jgi:hypothetical protein
VANIIHISVFKPWEAAGETTAAKTFSVFVNKHLFHEKTTIPEIDLPGDSTIGPDFPLLFR